MPIIFKGQDAEARPPEKIDNGQHLGFARPVARADDDRGGRAGGGEIPATDQMSTCTRGKGDIYTLYRLKVREMRQSLRIIEQALERLEKTPGPVMTSNRKVAPPPKQELQSSMESLIHHFKLWTEGFKPPVGFVYQAVESPRGELGFLVSSDGSNKPHRVHVRAPSFANLQLLPYIAKGRFISDLVGLIAMIDIVLGDVDR